MELKTAYSQIIQEYLNLKQISQIDDARGQVLYAAPRSQIEQYD